MKCENKENNHLCEKIIEKGKESYINGKVVCQNCFKDLKSENTIKREGNLTKRKSWLDKLINKDKLE